MCLIAHGFDKGGVDVLITTAHNALKDYFGTEETVDLQLDTEASLRKGTVIKTVEGLTLEESVDNFLKRTVEAAGSDDASSDSVENSPSKSKSKVYPIDFVTVLSIFPHRPLASRCTSFFMG